MWACCTGSSLVGSRAGEIHWLWALVDGGLHNASWDLAWEAWQRVCVETPRRWKSIVRRAQSQVLGLERWETRGGMTVDWSAGGASLPEALIDPSPAAHFFLSSLVHARVQKPWARSTMPTGPTGLAMSDLFEALHNTCEALSAYPGQWELPTPAS